ncbi:MAG: histidine phosphatase family protein [Candidatus Melainabacteria bacterium]|nr:histidine phosphatase family protein [Candidatus Melainabacteria bacterium]
MIDSNKKYLVVARHGESFANRRLRKDKDGIKYSLAGSDASIGLTPRGKKQALNTGKRLAGLFTGASRFVRMFDNRFERVSHTGKLIASQFDYGLECIRDKRIEKRSYGIFWNLTYRGVKELHPDEYAIFEALGPFKYRPPGGENYYDLFERIEEFADELALAASEGNQLVVTSSAAMLAFRRHYGGLADAKVLEMYESMQIGNGDFDVYELDETSGKWKLKYVYTGRLSPRKAALRAA